MAETPPDRRLIEDWLPIAALSEECIRERRSMTALPPTYYLHVWWARRPLVAARAAILAALLPKDADHEKFLHVLGIHGDPVAAKLRIAQATRDGVRLGSAAYGYPRAFSYTPRVDDLDWLRNAAGLTEAPSILDPTAGGGSIPFEAVRLGCTTLANDLNPVAWLILKATVEFPAKYGADLLRRYEKLGAEFAKRCVEAIRPFFPDEPMANTVPDGYLWARTVTCPYCAGVVPLSPNWRLDNKGTGVRLIPCGSAAPGGEAGAAAEGGGSTRVIRFEIVYTLNDQSPGTVSGGNGTCPFPDCGRVIEGDEIKAQAQSGKMGEQLYCVVYREHQVTGYTKAGKEKIKKVRGFRAPRPEDDVRDQVRAALDAKLPEWEARGIIPDEVYPDNTNDDRPRQYGMPLWRDMFSPRQLYGHCVSVEVFHGLVEECGGPAKLSELDKAALTYLAIAMDKLLDWNSYACTWEPATGRLHHTFARHDFAFRWSFGEMAPAVTGIGYDWVLGATGKALRELLDLTGRHLDLTDELPGVFQNEDRRNSVTLWNSSGDSIEGIGKGCVNLVVMDPPYYDNVMYAELADFFYVWLKRTAGLLYPEAFSSYLCDKDREAVANTAKFKDFSQVKGTGGAKKRATRDYQERMQAIFAECRRVLKPAGVMVLMFTHKATGAWDALARGLVDAGFVITASWPISTEAHGSLHIMDKNAAKSTIFLVCRPRAAATDLDEVRYWEEVEPEVVKRVRERVAYFQDNGIKGVDLYLSCFGPALQVFSEQWPMQRGRALQKPEPAKGAQLKLVEEEEWDPYAVRPEDALNAARVAVKEWRLDKLTRVKRQVHLDTVTEFYVLAWDAFESPQFPADEALKLARVVGVSFDGDLRGRILEVKGGDVILWDSHRRVQKGSLGAPSVTNMLNVLHHLARKGRETNTGEAKRFLESMDLLDDPLFKTSLETMLNVLPAPALAKSSNPQVAGAAEDAAALEKLRRLCYDDADVPPPLQPELALETPEA